MPTPEVMKKEDEDLDTDQETDRLLGQQYNDDTGYYDTVKNESSKKKAAKPKEGNRTLITLIKLSKFHRKEGSKLL